MKLFYTPLLVITLFSCTQKEKIKIAPATSSSIRKIVKKNNPEPSQTKFKSILRPNQDLELNKTYLDTVQFVEFNTDFDYFFIAVKKGNETTTLNTNSDNINFNRGDILEVKWKMDSIFIAGDGERLDFAEWLVNFRKIKEGNLSLFKKKYKKPIKYYTANQNLSDSFKNYLYTVVEFYLANSDKELVKANLKDPNLNLTYSIEDQEKEGKNYTVLGIANEFEHHTSIIQWLYIDNESKKIYEYDLPNDKLIEFKK